MVISSVSSSAQLSLASKSGRPPLTPLVFDSLDAMEANLFDVEKKAVAKYRTEFETDGNKALSVDELKDMLKKRFPGYTLTDTEPTEPVKGKNLLYIDDSNLKKMADDADYRTKVMGLMEREYVGTSPMVFNLGDTKFHSFTTGSVFSLSDKNQSVDGVPYSGMSMGEGFSESGPRDEPLSGDLLSKTWTGRATGKSAASKPGSAAWLKEVIEKRQEELKETQRKAAAAEAQKTSSEERAAQQGVDIVV